MRPMPNLNPIAWAAASGCVAALGALTCVTVLHEVAFDGVHGSLFVFSPWLSDMLVSIGALLTGGAALCLFLTARRKRPTLWTKRAFGTCVAAWMGASGLTIWGTLNEALDGRWRPLAFARSGTTRYCLLTDRVPSRGRRYLLAREVSASSAHLQLRLLGELPEVPGDPRDGSGLASRLQAAELQSGSTDVRQAVETLLPETRKLQRQQGEPGNTHSSGSPYTQ